MKEHMVPIFKTGRHTSRGGATRSYNESDLDRFASTYNGQASSERHDAPAVIGHPKLDAPAFGLFSKLKRNGSILYGSLRDASPEFIDTVKAGHYRKVSAKFDSNGLLKHVGWLGAQAPAVKGLPEFSFSEEDLDGDCYDIDLTFSEPDDDLDEMSNKNEPKTAASATATTPKESAPNHKAPKETTTATPATVETPETVTATEFAEFQKKQEAENKRLTDELAAERQKTRELEFSEYLGGDDLKGRVTPAMKPGLTRIMHSLADSSDEYEFSEGDKEIKQSPLDALKAVIEKLPVSVEFGEMATEGPATGASEFSEAEEKELDELVDSIGG